jgi:hypothetical protein
VVPWEALITGAVGIGGISLGAWLTGRLQTKNLRLSLNAEADRGRLDEKRRIYSDYVSALAKVVSVAQSLRDYSESANPQERAAMVREKQDAIVHLVDAANELALIAPPELTDTSARTIDEYADECEEGGHPAQVRFYEMRLKLYGAMRTDLGESS